MSIRLTLVIFFHVFIIIVKLLIVYRRAIIMLYLLNVLITSLGLNTRECIIILNRSPANFIYSM